MAFDRHSYTLKQRDKRDEIMKRDTWTDIDKLEYLIANIRPYSHFWRLGMIRTLRKALVMMKGDYKKIVKACWIPTTDYPSWRHFQVYQCSNCKTEEVRTYKYCPNCGAEMFKKGE